MDDGSLYSSAAEAAGNESIEAAPAARVAGGAGGAGIPGGGGSVDAEPSPGDGMVVLAAVMMPLSSSGCLLLVDLERWVGGDCDCDCDLPGLLLELGHGLGVGSCRHDGASWALWLIG